MRRASGYSSAWAKRSALARISISSVDRPVKACSRLGRELAWSGMGSMLGQRHGTGFVRCGEPVGRAAILPPTDPPVDSIAPLHIASLERQLAQGVRRLRFVA